MKNLKRITILAMVGVIALTAAGCDNTSSNSTELSSEVGTARGSAGSSAASGETTEMRIWTRGSGPDEDIQKLIEFFNESQSEIHATYEYYGENYSSMVQMAISGDSALDILEYSGGIAVQTLAKQEQTIPVGDCTTNEIKENYSPSTFTPEEFYLNGELYSIPVHAGAYRLLHNKDLFKEAGLNPEESLKTLEEMREYAKKITEAGGGEVYGFGLPLGVAQIWGRMIDPILYATNGIQRYGWSNATKSCDFGPSKDYFNFYMDMMEDGSLFPGYLTLGIDTLRVNFTAGTIGMYIDGTWTPGSYTIQMGAKCSWDSTPLPVLESNAADEYWAEGDVNWVVGSGRNVETTKKFCAYWLSNQTIANQYMPVPGNDNRTNDLDFLGVEDLNLQGAEYGFKTGDLDIPKFEPHRFISLEGDDRSTVSTNLFAKTAEGADVSADLDAAAEDLNQRYTLGLEDAIASGSINKSSVKQEKTGLL